VGPGASAAPNATTDATADATTAADAAAAAGSSPAAALAALLATRHAAAAAAAPHTAARDALDAAVSTAAADARTAAAAAQACAAATAATAGGDPATADTLTAAQLGLTLPSPIPATIPAAALAALAAAAAAAAATEEGGGDHAAAAAAATAAAARSARCSPHLDLSFVDHRIKGGPHHAPPPDEDGRPTPAVRYLPGLQFVGAFAGDHAWVEEQIVAQIRDNLADVPTIGQLDDVGRINVAKQGAHGVLKWCASSTPTHWLRTTRPSLSARAAGEHDRIVGAATAHLYRLPGHCDTHLRQARLPVGMGGLGYTSATTVRHAAYVGSWALAWPAVRRRVLPLADLDVADDGPNQLPAVRELHAALRHLRSERDRLGALYAAWDATTLATSRRGVRHTQFHPPGLPSQLPSVEELASAPDGVGKVQSAAAAVAHHAAWVDLYHERCSHGRASAAHFISVSQPYSGAFLQAVPSAPDLRMASDAFEVAVQRRLRAPLAVLGGERHSRVLGRAVDPLGDALQNLHAHGTRHNKPLKRWLAAFRAVFGTACVMEDRRHHVYSPDVQPDLTHRNGAPDGTHHALYEQKVKSPLSVTESGTGLLGGKAAFGNTADDEYDLILGAPARAEGGAAQIGVYDAALRAGHRVHPIVMEVFGGFHPDAAKLVDTLAKKHGSRLGADLLAAPWCARSFRSLHTQRISVALHLAAAEEILDTVMLDRAAAAARGAA
jgi:hypothetical protein